MFETKDLLLFASRDGGEISIQNKDIALGEQLFQQIYISLFGGNVEAETRGDELPTEIRNDWWGNSLFFADKKVKQFNSATEKALNENALTSSGRINILRAVESDLTNFANIATFTADVTLPGLNKVQIEIRFVQPINQQGASVKLLWDNAKKEIIEYRTI